MPQFPVRPATILALAALHTACGGGGGGGGGNEATEPAPEPVASSYTITGTVSASASQAVDGDNNDPLRVTIPNDSFDTAQAIPNPITLGGYVNQPGTGAEGRSRDSGDTEDFFRVHLLAGQTITMLVADYREADADLYLYNMQGEVLAYSIEYGELETITVPADGTYLVNASAVVGATNYILAIGAAVGAVGSSQAPEIIPWELVLKYRDEEPPERESKSPPREFNRLMALEQRAGGRGRGRLMALRRAGLTSQEVSQRLGQARAKREQIHDEQLRSRWETLMAIKTLRRDPAIDYAEPNYRVRSHLTPDDEAFPFQWHYPLIDLPTAWDTVTGDPGVIVAVIDTGILSGHPDLRDQLVPGYDFVRDAASAGDGNGIDPDPQDPGNNRDPGSSAFHGSHVAGTVAAAGDNGIGVTGVAWDSRIMPLRALGRGGAGSSYDVSQAIRFAAGLPNDSGTVPAEAAQVINMSLGGGGFSRPDQELLQAVRSRGIAVVAAAGNEASTLPSYPAAYEGVISVGAVDSQGRLARYSNRGSSVDLVAPGGDNGVDLNGDGYPDGVLSTGATGSGGDPDYAYTFRNGTSMAAPHVAGVLALMKSANPGLTAEDIDVLLSRGDLTDDLGAPGRDDLYGHGLINARSAVQAAIEAGDGSPASDPRLVASARTLNFGLSGNRLQLALRNGGEGELLLESVEASRPWVSVAAEQVDGAGLGRYRVEVDRRDLAEGIYSAEILLHSSANSLSVQVLVSVGQAGAAADVGLVYILLHDLDSDETYDQVVATSNGGQYHYRFDQVPPGNYEIAAGSDADNDLFICDPGEACGAWLTLDQPIRLQPDSDQFDLDFAIEYLVSIPGAADSRQTPVQSRPRAPRGIAKGS